ncbi:hypothetical protein ONZ43_g3803 [Nemania bipapillata]|uniref:Uncharacterized protein n=1 Tax=Nemania bipapillata TaxID=110536 RepID=A0ACC2IVI9_9PEZI|nr:hypothetical protein ONZ43_g3803 [Nemania bipapillata]
MQTPLRRTAKDVLCSPNHTRKSTRSASFSTTLRHRKDRVRPAVTTKQEMEMGTRCGMRKLVGILPLRPFGSSECTQYSVQSRAEYPSDPACHQENPPKARTNEKPENDNLRHEYITLFSQVEKSIAFARIALGRDPDAINMWIGNSRSVTALHRDNYENVYVQVVGCKHFVLLPPLFQPCVNEQDLEPATYVRGHQATGWQKGGGDRGNQGNQGNRGNRENQENRENRENLQLRMDEPREREPPLKVPFATWDPDTPDLRATPYSHLAKPMRVSLEPGDMLYLPAMW